MKWWTTKDFLGLYFDSVLGKISSRLTREEVEVYPYSPLVIILNITFLCLENSSAEI